MAVGRTDDEGVGVLGRAVHRTVYGIRPYKYGGHTVYGASVYRNRIDKIYILAVRYGIRYGRNTVQYGYGATYFECVIVQHLHNCRIW